MSVKIEFAGGGPADGNVRDIEGAKPHVIVYAPSLEAGWSTDRPEDNHPFITHVYRRADRVTRGGARVYEYIGKKRST